MRNVWWRANEGSNSIGNLLLHLEGSTRAWIIGVAGGFYIARDRQQEFDEREQIPRAALVSRLRQTLTEADRVLARLDAEVLLERRKRMASTRRPLRPENRRGRLPPFRFGDT